LDFAGTAVSLSPFRLTDTGFKHQPIWMPCRLLSKTTTSSCYAIDQTAQGMRTKGDFESNVIVFPGGMLRYEF